MKNCAKILTRLTPSFYLHTSTERFVAPIVFPVRVKKPEKIQQNTHEAFDDNSNSQASHLSPAHVNQQVSMGEQFANLLFISHQGFTKCLTVRIEYITETDPRTHRTSILSGLKDKMTHTIFLLKQVSVLSTEDMMA